MRVGSGRAHSAAVNLRRAVFATFGVALVVAVEAVPRSLSSSASPVLVGYSVLIWAAIPALVTFGVAGLATLTRDVELPMWLVAVVAGLATATWVTWGVGDPWGSLYGLMLGLGGASAGVSSAAGWPVPVRLFATAAIAVATSLLVGLVSAG